MMFSGETGLCVVICMYMCRYVYIKHNKNREAKYDSCMSNYIDDTRFQFYLYFLFFIENNNIMSMSLSEEYDIFNNFRVNECDEQCTNK